MWPSPLKPPLTLFILRRRAKRHASEAGAFDPVKRIDRPSVPERDTPIWGERQGGKKSEVRGQKSEVAEGISGRDGGISSSPHRRMARPLQWRDTRWVGWTRRSTDEVEG